MLDESPTSANLGIDPGFIYNQGIIGMGPFGEAQSKAMRAYAQSGQYHTCGESCSSNIVSEPYPKLSHANRILKCQQRTPKKKKVERNTISIGGRPFGEAQSKAMRAYAHRG